MQTFAVNFHLLLFRKSRNLGGDASPSTFLIITIHTPTQGPGPQPFSVFHFEESRRLKLSTHHNGTEHEEGRQRNISTREVVCGAVMRLMEFPPRSLPNVIDSPTPVPGLLGQRSLLGSVKQLFDHQKKAPPPTSRFTSGMTTCTPMRLRWPEGHWHWPTLALMVSIRILRGWGGDEGGHNKQRG